MKNLIIIATLLLGLPLVAQTKVVKKNAVKANNFGITYSLPKTSLIVEAEVTKVTCKAGPYYQYAEKYLAVQDAIAEDAVYYELGKVRLINRGVPDPAAGAGEQHDAAGGVAGRGHGDLIWRRCGGSPNP